VAGRLKRLRRPHVAQGSQVANSCLRLSARVKSDFPFLFYRTVVELSYASFIVK
jgi:hypothetical protein